MKLRPSFVHRPSVRLTAAVAFLVAGIMIGTGDDILLPHIHNKNISRPAKPQANSTIGKDSPSVSPQSPVPGPLKPEILWLKLQLQLHPQRSAAPPADSSRRKSRLHRTPIRRPRSRTWPTPAVVGWEWRQSFGGTILGALSRRGAHLRDMRSWWLCWDFWCISLSRWGGRNNNERE